MTKRIPVTVRQTARANLADTFHIAMPIDLTKIFTGYAFLPAIVRVENQTGPWDHVGVSRNPVFANGKGAFERITAYTPPASFEYDVSKFTNILARLVSGAHGSWTFAQDPTALGQRATTIEWTYAFLPLRFRRTLVRILVVPAWRRYMGRALALTVLEVEKTASIG